jgi:hypothetical protein
MKTPRTAMSDHVAAGEADKLLAGLDAAPDDPARLALLNAAPRKVREALSHQLWYRKFISDSADASAAQQAAFDAFSRQLDEATDDDARLQIIAAAQADPQRGHDWLAEWSWRRTATEEDGRRRYLAAVNGGVLPPAFEL